jgi:UDPglucose--hexose-1-phosphate uridylyltransferase
MPELRKEPFSGRWVVFSPERKQRPQEFPVFPLPKTLNAFLGGHEELTPPEVFAVRAAGTLPNKPGWRVRVVPNRFPALRIEGDLNPEAVGFYDKINGIGAHEVIIETPLAEPSLESLPVDHIADVLKAYRARTLDLMRDTRFRYILIFKNQGPLAGASLSHAHSQLIALPITPLAVKQKLQTCRKYYEDKERCLFEDLLRQEQKEGTRVVYENNGFAVFCPYASRFTFEHCIMRSILWRRPCASVCRNWPPGCGTQITTWCCTRPRCVNPDAITGRRSRPIFAGTSRSSLA